MKKRFIKYIARLVALLAVLGVAWVAWILHPWMPAGRAIHLGSWKIAGRECEVWQRKNDSFGEPFSTSLFIRTQTDQWLVYCLDFEDTYAPAFELQANGSRLEILRDGETLGFFDTRTEIFKRAVDLVTMSADIVSKDPAANW